MILFIVYAFCDECATVTYFFLRPAYVLLIIVPLHFFTEFDRFSGRLLVYHSG